MRTQKAFPQNNPKIDFAASFASPKQSPKKLFNELASQGNAKSLSTSENKENAFPVEIQNMRTELNKLKNQLLSSISKNKKLALVIENQATDAKLAALKIAQLEEELVNSKTEWSHLTKLHEDQLSLIQKENEKVVSERDKLLEEKNLLNEQIVELQAQIQSQHEINTETFSNSESTPSPVDCENCQYLTARNQAISVEFEKTAQAYAIQKSLSQQLQKTNENLTLEVRELTYTKDECFTRIEQLVTCVDELHHSIETLNENLSNEHKAKLKLEYQVSALEIQVEHANQQIEKLNDQNADLENEVNETSQKFEELLFEHETLIEETEEVNQLMEERFNDEKKRGVLFELIVEAQRSAIEQSSEEVIRLQERMKEIEIARGELKEENEKLEALIAEMRAKNESEAEKSIALNHELRNRNDKLESLVAELRQDNKSLEDKLAFRDSEINLISKRIESKEEMFHENDTRLAVMKQEIEMLAVRNEELKQQNEKLESLMTEMRVDSMREAEKSVAQNQLLKLQNESLESIVAEMRAENEREAEKSAELNQQLKEQNNKLEALVAEMRAENEREAEKSTTLNRLLKDHNDKLEVLVAEIREKNQKEIEKSTVLNQEEIAKFESLIFDSREENQILQEKISFYQLEMKSLCAQRENNLELLQQNEKLHSLISEIKEENANLQRRAELFETKVKSLTSQLEESQLLAEEHQKFLLEAREDNERLHQKIACYEIEMKAICQQMECNEELKRQNEKLGAVIVELREEKERELERVSTQSQDEIELLKKANNLGLQEAAEERMRLTKEIQEANDNLKELHDRLQKIEAENEATKQLNFWLVNSSTALDSELKELKEKSRATGESMEVSQPMIEKISRELNIQKQVNFQLEKNLIDQKEINSQLEQEMSLLKHYKTYETELIDARTKISSLEREFSALQLKEKSITLSLQESQRLYIEMKSQFTAEISNNAELRIIVEKQKIELSQIEEKHQREIESIEERRREDERTAALMQEQQQSHSNEVLELRELTEQQAKAAEESINAHKIVVEQKNEEISSLRKLIDEQRNELSEISSSHQKEIEEKASLRTEMSRLITVAEEQMNELSRLEAKYQHAESEQQRLSNELSKLRSIYDEQQNEITQIRERYQTEIKDMKNEMKLLAETRSLEEEKARLLAQEKNDLVQSLSNELTELKKVAEEQAIELREVKEKASEARIQVAEEKRKNEENTKTIEGKLSVARSEISSVVKTSRPAIGDVDNDSFKIETSKYQENPQQQKKPLPSNQSKAAPTSFFVPVSNSTQPAKSSTSSISTISTSKPTGLSDVTNVGNKSWKTQSMSIREQMRKDRASFQNTKK